MCTVAYRHLLFLMKRNMHKKSYKTLGLFSIPQRDPMEIYILAYEADRFWLPYAQTPYKALAHTYFCFLGASPNRHSNHSVLI